MNYLRGDVFYADLGIGFGSEQGGTRPVIVIQNNMGNKYSPCVIVIPVTTSTTKHKIPTQTLVSLNRVYGIAYGEQIRTIDKKRIKEKLDHINDMTNINKALIISLALEGAC